MFELIAFVTLVTVGYFVGSQRERTHLEDLRRREKLLLDLPVQMDPGPPLSSGEVFLVAANVVIASDYFKNFVGSLKSLFGGRLTTHETLIDRARREAIVRLKESARAQGATSLVNVRLQTSFLDQLGVEIMAYGTAVRP